MQLRRSSKNACDECPDPKKCCWAFICILSKLDEIPISLNINSRTQERCLPNNFCALLLWHLHDVRAAVKYPCGKSAARRKKAAYGGMYHGIIWQSSSLQFIRFLLLLQKVFPSCHQKLEASAQVLSCDSRVSAKST